MGVLLMPSISSSSIQGHVDPTGAKAVLRQKAAIRRQCEADESPEAAQKLVTHSQLLVQSYGLGIYAAYMPIRSEISPLPLLRALEGMGIKTAMPITPAEGQPLSFHIWKIGDPLDNGPYSTQQPHANAPTTLPNVILAPLLAFDLAGWRLGYGGGFYDRTIADMSRQGHEVKVIGLAYDGQKLEKVPVGPYDMPLDAILCPSGLFRPAS